MVIEKVGSVIFMIDFLWNTHTPTQMHMHAQQLAVHMSKEGEGGGETCIKFLIS